MRVQRQLWAPGSQTPEHGRTLLVEEGKVEGPLHGMTLGGTDRMGSAQWKGKQREGLGLESDIPCSGPNMLGAGESEGGQISEPQWLQV